MMKIVILEDEIRTARHLENMLKQYDATITVPAIIPSVAAAVAWFEANSKPDLVMMDIHLEDELVFGLFSKLSVKIPVIFTTAYDQYTMQAFKVSGIEYLLKPVQYVDLAAALEKFKSIHQHFVDTDYQRLAEILQQPAATVKYKDRFLSTAGTKMFSIETKDIAYVSLVAKASWAVTKSDKKFILDHSLDELANMLDPSLFMRVNRQTIVSLDAIQHAQQIKPGQFRLELIPLPPEPIFVSGDRLQAFREWLGK